MNALVPGVSQRQEKGSQRQVAMRPARRLRRLFRNESPIHDPWYVRAFLVGHWLIWGCVIIFLRPPPVKALAFTGIILGTIGAAILYWETTLDEEEVAVVTAYMSRNANKLRTEDKVTIIFNGFVGFVLFAQLIAQKTQNDHEFGLAMTVLYYGISIIFLITPPAATYFGLKASSNSRSKKATRLNEQDFAGRKAYIAHSYRLTGGWFLVLGGWAQIPLILVG